MTEDMPRCIETCLSCDRTCLSTAMDHCLETGGKHVEPAHFRLMMACAEMYRTPAHFMLINTPHHRHLPRVRRDLRARRRGLQAHRRHGDFIAHRIGCEKPAMGQDGSYVSVCDAGVLEIARFPLASPQVH